jgi:deoxycytidylate deaminase
MKFTHNHIRILRNLAKKSNLVSRHAAMLFTKKEFYFGYNTSRSYIDGILKPTLHAEMDVLKRYARKNTKSLVNSNVLKRKKCSILVIRINKDDELVNSKPCSSCMEHMRSINIKSVYYSDDDGDIVMLDLNDPCMMSSGYRQYLL